MKWPVRRRTKKTDMCIKMKVSSGGQMEIDVGIDGMPVEIREERKTRARCIICHRPLTDSASVELQMGPVCAKRVGAIPAPNAGFRRSHQSDYAYAVRDFGKWKVHVLIDKRRVGIKYVENNLRYIMKELGAGRVIYRRKDGMWCYFDGNEAEELIDSEDMDEAVRFARVRILGEFEGLFNEEYIKEIVGSGYH